MGDPICGRAEDLFSARLFQSAFSKAKRRKIKYDHHAKDNFSKKEKAW